MSAVILDGKALAASIKKDLTARTSALKASGKVPGLGTILVGDDPGSHSYVSGKHRDCAEVGITSFRIDLPANASQSDVLAAVKDLNNNPECTGYIVQLPLPQAINTQMILESIDPAKDGAAIGIGMGQVNRVDSAKLAVDRAGDRVNGTVAASDAFFPFADGLEILIRAGVTAVVQPGGSVRDEEVIAAANAAGIAMFFTGTRHFSHA